MGRGVIGSAVALVSVLLVVHFDHQNLGRPFALIGEEVASPSAVLCRAPAARLTGPWCRRLAVLAHAAAPAREDVVALAFFDEGRDILRRARASTGDDLSFDVTLEPGLVIELESAFGLARRYFERALARGLRPQECQALIARCLVGMSDGTRQDDPEVLRAQARLRVRGVLVTAIRDPETLLALGETLESLDDFNGALRAYEECARRDPTEGRAHLGAALAILQSGVPLTREFWRHYNAISRQANLVDRFRMALRRRTEPEEPDDLFATPPQFPPRPLLPPPPFPLPPRPPLMLPRPPMRGAFIPPSASSTRLFPLISTRPDGSVDVPLTLALLPPRSPSEVLGRLDGAPFPSGFAVGRPLPTFRAFYMIDLGRAGFTAMTFRYRGLMDNSDEHGELVVQVADTSTGPWRYAGVVPSSGRDTQSDGIVCARPFRYVRFAAADWTGRFAQSGLVLFNLFAEGSAANSSVEDDLGL